MKFNPKVSKIMCSISVIGTRYEAFGVRYEVLGIRSSVLNMKPSVIGNTCKRFGALKSYQVPSVWCEVLCVRYQVFGIIK